MYSVSQATIKDTLLEASEMPSLGYVTSDHTSDIESPPTPDKCVSPLENSKYCPANTCSIADIRWAVWHAYSGGGGAWS